MISTETLYALLAFFTGSFLFFCILTVCLAYQVIQHNKKIAKMTEDIQDLKNREEEEEEYER